MGREWPSIAQAPGRYETCCGGDGDPGRCGLGCGGDGGECACTVAGDTNPGDDFLRSCAEAAEERAAQAEAAEIRAGWERRYALRERDRWRRRFRVLLIANIITWCALAVLAAVYYFPQIRSAQPLHMSLEEVNP